MGDMMSKSRNFLLAVFGFFLSLLFIFVILLMIHVKRTHSIYFIDDLTCKYREVIHISHFIKDLDGTLIDDYLVDTSVVGKNQMDVQYKNRYGFVEKERINIEVQDVTPPTIVVDDTYVVSMGKVDNLVDTIFCADDYDDNVKCHIIGKYDLNSIGSYSLKIEAIDKSGNKSKKDFVLSVVEDSDSSTDKLVPVKFNTIYQKYQHEYDVGIDVSKWQGEIDFSKIVNQGVSFVMIKIGGQTEIGGEIVLDPNFVANIEKALENHLKVGVYFYSYAKSPSEAKKQARWVVQQLDTYHLDLPIAFDWEEWEHYHMFGISFRTLNYIASSFISEVDRYQLDGMLYSSKSYLETIWYPDFYSNVWLAYYNDKNSYQGNYLMWQISNSGVIDGIDGFVDIDLLKKG